MSSISLRLPESLHRQARAARGSRRKFDRVLKKVRAHDRPADEADDF